MSGFDKEAERERLREKYERDEKKRANTRRMSELLLKGATMTNRHCDTCGDPVFRYDGQEFCATCQAAGRDVDAGAADADAEGRESADATDAGASEGEVDAARTPERAEAPSTADEAGGANAAGNVEPAPETPTGDDRAAAGGDASTAPAAPSPDRTVDAGAAAGSTPDSTGRQSRSDRAAPESAPRAPAVAEDGRTAGVAPGAATTTGPGTGASEGEVDVRASLRRVIERQVGAAESADDPRRAREHLAAAREAAETLAALRR